MHVPDLVRFGSKPARELRAHPPLEDPLRKKLRSFSEVVGYPPHQVFIGNLTPEDLRLCKIPRYENLVDDAASRGRFGEICDEAFFYRLLVSADQFGLLSFEEGWSKGSLGRSRRESEIRLREGSLPIFLGERLVGSIHRGHEEDPSLIAEILLENLAAKATASHSLGSLLLSLGIPLDQIDYVLSASEEAVGDRYNRGGGNLAKAIAEESGCVNASGIDLKAFCAGPLYAMIHGASLIQSGLCKNVAVVAGGSLAKLGMKFQSHLEKRMPVLEDVLASFAVLLGPPNEKDPCLRLDSVGFHPVRAGSSPQEMAEYLVEAPLARLGKKLIDVDRFAVELHNPEITLPSGSGDVPRTNYLTLAAIAVIRGQIQKEEMEDFIRRRGMSGYAPTQGHIPSAISYLGHAREALMRGEIRNAMFISKGSLFLGRMTQLSDGCSFLLERAKE